MLAWTFRVTSMPWDLANFRNACGSGNSAGVHSQPPHWLGDFQSVTTERSSSGTLLARNAGISVFSQSEAVYGEKSEYQTPEVDLSRRGEGPDSSVRSCSAG